MFHLFANFLQECVGSYCYANHLIVGYEPCGLTQANPNNRQQASITFPIELPALGTQPSSTPPRARVLRSRSTPTLIPEVSSNLKPLTTSRMHLRESNKNQCLGRYLRKNLLFPRIDTVKHNGEDTKELNGGRQREERSDYIFPGLGLSFGLTSAD